MAARSFSSAVLRSACSTPKLSLGAAVTPRQSATDAAGGYGLKTPRTPKSPKTPTTAITPKAFVTTTSNDLWSTSFVTSGPPRVMPGRGREPSQGRFGEKGLPVLMDNLQGP